MVSNRPSRDVLQTQQGVQPRSLISSFICFFLILLTVFEPGSEYTRYPLFVVVMSHASFLDLVLTDFRSFPSRLYSFMILPWTVVQILSSPKQLTLPRLPSSFSVAMVLITFVLRGKEFVTIWPSSSCVTLENVTKPNLLYSSFSSIRCATYSGSGECLSRWKFFEFSIP